MLPRVLLLTNDFPPRVGGIERYCYSIAERLPRDRIVVYAPLIPGSRDFDSTLAFPVLRYPRDRFHPQDTLKPDCLPYDDVLSRVSEVIRKTDPDLVCFGAAFPLGLLAADIVRIHGIPCIGFAHGVEVTACHTPLLERLQYMSSHLSLLMAVSQWGVTELSRALGDRCRIELLRPGVAPDRFHPGAADKAMRVRYGAGDSPVCVCVARLVPGKGQDRLIEAWPAVTREVRDARLVLVGGGPDHKRLKELAAELHVSRQVHFVGEVPSESADLPTHYAAADVFAMPCRPSLRDIGHEAFGIAYLEAAASGLPVIAGLSGGAPETVVHSETGLLVDGDNVDAISSAVIKLLADPVLSRKMGAAGRDRIEKHFSWDKVLGTLAEYLRSAVTHAA